MARYMKQVHAFIFSNGSKLEINHLLFQDTC